MANYVSDRRFTDYVHKNLALDIIYRPLNWLDQDVDGTMKTNVDMNDAIDYFCIDMNRRKIITVQERFREAKYRDYNDFTIRYEREYNRHEERRLSEYYKLHADYFVYGIIDEAKVNMERATGFIKYAVIDIKKVKELIDCEKIVVDRTLRWQCKLVDGVIRCPVNQNYDYSSSFVPVDINMLYEICPESIVVRKGF